MYIEVEEGRGVFYRCETLERILNGCESSQDDNEWSWAALEGVEYLF